MKTVLNKDLKAKLLQVLKQGYFDYEHLEALAFSMGYALHEIKDPDRSIEEKQAELKDLLKKINWKHDED